MEEEYRDDVASHTIYEGENMIYIKNNFSLNTLSISKNNFVMSNINFQTVKTLNNFIMIKVYGILGIANLGKIPCLIYGCKYEVVAVLLEQIIYQLKDIYFMPLINYENKISKEETNNQFKILKQNILKTNLIFGYPCNLTIPYYQQNIRNIKEINSFLYNYELIIPFLSNNNIKNKHDFYTNFIDGYLHVFLINKIKGQSLLTYFIFRKEYKKNYYECEFIIRYDNDVYDNIYGIKIGNEEFSEEFIRINEKKSGIIFDCSNNENEKYLKQILPYFNYVKYSEKDFDEKSIEKFIEEQNKELKKIQYYFSGKDPLTGKVSKKYKQHELNQNGLCIFIFDDIKTSIIFNQSINKTLFINYFSQYQKEKDFKKQNNEFIKLKKIPKIDDIFYSIKHISIQFYKEIKDTEHINFTKYIYKSKISENEINNNKKIKLFIGTYNVSAIKSNIILSKFNVNLFLFPEKYSKYISINNLPDIICISFEEIVELNPSNILISSNEKIVDLYTSKITTLICENYPYILKLKKNLVGILTLFYIKSDLDEQINNLEVIENKTGILGLGNKGNFTVKLKLKNQNLIFVNGHLSAGDEKENFNKRVNELKEIFNNIKDENQNMDDLIYFIFGDLNFRIDLPKQKFNEICCRNYEGVINENQAKNNINELKKYEQINEVVEIFKKEKLYEEKINFPPTYKYIKESFIYDEKRTPSWTDRILFKKSDNIKCKFYDTVDLYISDHKPVIGLFEINL